MKRLVCAAAACLLVAGSGFAQSDDTVKPDTINIGNFTIIKKKSGDTNPTPEETVTKRRGRYTYTYKAEDRAAGLYTLYLAKSGGYLQALRFVHESTYRPSSLTAKICDFFRSTGNLFRSRGRYNYSYLSNIQVIKIKAI